MKSIVLGLFMFALCAFSTHLSAVDFLMIKGTVSAEGRKCAGAEINIYDGNELLQVDVSNSKGKFELQLFAGSRYTIEFTHPKMVTKRLVFDLRTDDFGANPEVFECDVFMYTPSYLSGMSPSILDFPMAILEYNHKKQRLEFNTAYTDTMQELYQNMLIFAENTNRTIWEQE